MNSKQLDPRLSTSDPALDEHTVSSETVFSGHFLKVRRDVARMPDGRTATREHILHPGAVMIVPLLDDGRVVLERQYRYPLQRVFLEFPAGKIDAGEAMQVCGERELYEETGYRAREWVRLGAINNAIGYCDEVIEIWLARGLEQSGARQLDEHEHLEVVTATLDELLGWIRSGEVTDVKTIIGAYWAELFLAGRWTAPA
ncbi:NUDIX domain-containing protein [Derxia lacustris]|uniref:NUDIX domain-containing protein n=1 Tax=Derxia lacustris TaxID=764842 RepID=UPI000A17794B|nr:NUDIX hydrolase [Derxia lacustris]